MIAEAFLICALAAPALHYPHKDKGIGSYHLMRDELEDLKDFIRKNDPGADIFITPKGQLEKLREHGWEQLPFTHKDKEIWIKRKPRTDKAHRSVLESA